MRTTWIKGLVISLVFVVGCEETDVGKPCPFLWPKNIDNEVDCTAFPKCAPLQLTENTIGKEPLNNACPEDCVQLGTWECENLICVATQIEGNTSNMNGECAPEHHGSVQCPNAPFGCIGYCSKTCLSDASCPKGYRCSPLAPFDLNCENVVDWGNSCTDTCVPSGQTISLDSQPAQTITCPSTKETNWNHPDPTQSKICDRNGYDKCCACICNKFCPLLSMKFCSMKTFAQDTFPSAKTNAVGCGQQTD